MAHDIDGEALLLHIINVGFGDAILIEMPEIDGRRTLGLVDCYSGSKKVIPYIKKLKQTRANIDDGLAFLCATHPHWDHISGIPAVLDEDTLTPAEFWDSGFRHKSLTYRSILEKLDQKNISVTRVSSGMEWYFGKVRITALAPSILLRNRYATYGVDINNSSIVLRLEHHRDSVLMTESLRYEGNRDPMLERKAGSKVALLGGDAEFDSWARICEEFPRLESTKNHKGVIARKVVNMLGCSVVKVSHHGSMHSTPLDAFERMSPKLAVISAQQKQSTLTVDANTTLERNMFPHSITATALTEVCAHVVTTDGSYESEDRAKTPGEPRDPARAHQGTVVVVIPPKGDIRWTKLDDDDATTLTIPTKIEDNWETISA